MPTKKKTIEILDKYGMLKKKVFPDREHPNYYNIFINNLLTMMGYLIILRVSG